MSDITIIPSSSQVTVVPRTDSVAVVVPQTSLAAVVVTNSVISVGTGDLSNFYNKTETDTLLAGKANFPIVVDDISDFNGTVLAGGTF